MPWRWCRFYGSPVVDKQRTNLSSSASVLTRSNLVTRSLPTRADQPARRNSCQSVVAEEWRLSSDELRPLVCRQRSHGKPESASAQAWGPNASDGVPTGTVKVGPAFVLFGLQAAQVAGDDRPRLTPDSQLRNQRPAAQFRPRPAGHGVACCVGGASSIVRTEH
jgi:hypothetical protein